MLRYLMLSVTFTKIYIQQRFQIVTWYHSGLINLIGYDICCIKYTILYLYNLINIIVRTIYSVTVVNGLRNNRTISKQNL